MRVSVDDLVQQVLEVDNTPIAQATFTTTQIAQYLDFELQSTVVPIIRKLNEEFFVTTMSVQVGPDTPPIVIPSSAAGFAVRDVMLYSEDGMAMGKINRINPDQIPYISNGGNLWFSGISQAGQMQSYYIVNNEIVFFPRLTSTFLCHVRYFKAPNHLTLSTSAGGQITGKLAGNMLQLSNVPSTWTTFSGVNALTIDVTMSQSPYNFRTFPSTLAPNNVVIGVPGQPIINVPVFSVQPGFIIEVDAATWDAVQVGDFVWETEKCGFAQYVPDAALDLLRYRASMRICKAQGDLQNLNISAQLANAKMDDLIALITPKVQNMPEKVWNSSRLISSRGRNRFFPRF